MIGTVCSRRKIDVIDGEYGLRSQNFCAIFAEWKAKFCLRSVKFLSEKTEFFATKRNSHFAIPH